MNADRFKQIDELFDAVMDLNESERETFLAEKCKTDENLKKEVLSLLQAQNPKDNFLDKSAIKVAAQDFSELQTLVDTEQLIGEKISNYKIERLIGLGGMGQVFLAHDEKLDRKVALKVLPSDFVSKDERVKRFQIEARAVSALNHPYIVTIYDVGSHENTNFIATEFIEGKTLRQLINEHLKIGEIINVIIQSCEALSAAHNEGIIHRDIKPENIILRSDGYVKILDFGLAKLIESNRPLQFNNATDKGIIVGTPAYMSPTQIKDEKVDNRIDLWSLGVVFYELLTGKNPFKKPTRQATFHSILNEQIPLPSSFNSEIPPELDHVLIKALEKDPEISYQTASELRADLKRVQRNLDSSFSTKDNSSPSKYNVAKKSKYLLPITVLFIISFSLVIWIFFRNNAIPKGIDWSKGENIQLTRQNGIEYFPSIAPDGKSFVYASDAKGNFDIYSQRIGGQNPKNLTEHSTSDDTQPAFSRDGNWIAFRSERSPTGIYVMESTGENLKRVGDGEHPSWSPDGKEIVVSNSGMDAPNIQTGRDNQIFIINLETGSTRSILKKNAYFPTWSPNGKRIAFWFYPDATGRRDIATISADGIEEPKILTTNFGLSNWNAVWSPDGKFLYFVSDKNGNWNFWRIPIDENSGQALDKPEPVTAPSIYSRHLGFSADGKKMIYVQSERQSNIQGVEFDEKNERIVGTAKWITTGDREITRAVLSPDGNKFLMRQVRRTQDDLVEVNRDGTNWKDITDDVSYDRYARWSPDGSQIAFASDRCGVYEIWMADSDRLNLRQITFGNDDPQGTSVPVFSPDGKRLSYHRNAQTYILDLTKPFQEQTPFKLPPTDTGGTFAAWDWSPDGDKLVGRFRFESLLGYYSFSAKKYVRITKSAESVPSWLPDSRRFIYSFENKVLIADIETKRVKELFTIQEGVPRSPFVTPDGKFLYYDVLTNKSDIWLIDVSTSN
ncbi:MAG: serine/threonine-protein kinase [Pyrinomonadaceae bacterium]|nr:serine/threonine-protein kinase [Pyrinomonadaceae bacterium]